MEVRQLQIFLALADELNFTRTAERVNTVQSNVTAQIKSLEEELGVPLFDRLGRRVTLTQAGRRFQPFALQALTAMEQGQHAVRTGSAPAGPLRISAPESLLTYRLPPILRIYRRRYPGVELVFRGQFGNPLLGEIDSGKLDLTFTMGDEVASPTLQSVALRPERIVLFSDTAHPLAARRSVQATDLAGQALLLTEAGCGYRLCLERALALQDVRPGPITEFSSIEAMKQCVRVGMGIALLPAVVLAREIRLHQFKALRWSGPALDVTSHIVWHRDKWVSPAMQAFIELVRTHFAE
ncbi:MAG TPA: LysR family transcriptional regulator [Terracidiphilus sp.]|nr:LysR family transcriptional regulator [Terracidiphilus sp.]